MKKFNPILIVLVGFRAFWLDAETGRTVPFVAGGEGPEGEMPLEVPGSFDGLGEDDLRDLHSKLEARFQAERGDAKTRAQTDQLRTYREAQSRIVAELSTRAAEAKDVSEALTALDGEVPLPPTEGEGEGEEANEEGEKTTEGEGTEATPTPEAIAAGLSAAGTAAARGTQTTAEQAPVPARTRPRMAMTAAAGQQLVPFGQTVDLGQIGTIADNVKHALKSKGELVKAHVASVAAYEETEGLGVALLTRNNSLSQNDALIAEAVEAHQARRAERMGKPRAQTAAICEPLDILREIPDYVSQADPLTSALPSRPIGRLGFQFTPAVALSGVSSGVFVGWDDSDQATVDPSDPDTWKPCLDATCPSPCEITALADGACLTFDVTTEMSNPERIRDLLAKLTALRIRNRTIRLLDIMDDLSVQFTETGSYSLLPDAIYAIGKILPRLAYGERLEEEDYTLFVPPGFGESLVIDKNGKEFAGSEELKEQAEAAVRSLGALFGIDTVQLRDETDALFDALPAVNTPTALDDGPCTWSLRLIHTPSALYGSTGVIDTGIQSDPQLARQNKRQWFQEEFNLLTKHGSPPWAKIRLTSASSGSRAAASTKLTCS